MISYCRYDDIEIRDLTYIPGYEPEEDQRIYDIIKWEPCDPIYVETKSGQMKYMTETCYSIATLIWDSKEEDFYLKSVGTRWLEVAPSKEICNMILDFAHTKEKEFAEEDGDYD